MISVATEFRVAGKSRAYKVYLTWYLIYIVNFKKIRELNRAGAGDRFTKTWS